MPPPLSFHANARRWTHFLVAARSEEVTVLLKPSDVAPLRTQLGLADQEPLCFPLPQLPLVRQRLYEALAQGVAPANRGLVADLLDLIEECQSEGAALSCREQE